MGSRCRCLFVGLSLLFTVAAASRGQGVRRNDGSALAHISLGDSSAPPTEPLMLPRFPVLPNFPGRPAPPGVPGLPRMVQAAGTIFSGQVLSIARERALGGASIERMAITFHVDRGLRGATTGKNLTIHQWAGLWSSGQRYRAGERVLLFLYPASKLGLTSCVAGRVGRFAVDPRGWVLLSEQHLAAFGSDPVLAGRSRVSLDEFVGAIRSAGGEERIQP
jgi:hypothetical protein